MKKKLLVGVGVAVVATGVALTGVALKKRKLKKKGPELLGQTEPTKPDTSGEELTTGDEIDKETT